NPRVGRRRMFGTTRAASRPMRINIIIGSTHIREGRDVCRSGVMRLHPGKHSETDLLEHTPMSGGCTIASGSSPGARESQTPVASLGFQDSLIGVNAVLDEKGHGGAENLPGVLVHDDDASFGWIDAGVLSWGRHRNKSPSERPFNRQRGNDDGFGRSGTVQGGPDQALRIV